MPGPGSLKCAFTNVYIDFSLKIAALTHIAEEDVNVASRYLKKM